MKQLISLGIIAVLVMSLLWRVPVMLAGRLLDALVVQGVIPTDTVYTVRSALKLEISSPPTAVYVDNDLSRFKLYRDDILLGEFFLEDYNTAKKRLGAFPFRQTHGRIKRYEFRRSVTDGMIAKIHHAVLNATYVIFYDSEGNYAGYWFIVWQT
jgi:hypothetical protein